MLIIVCMLSSLLLHHHKWCLSLFTCYHHHCCCCCCCCGRRSSLRSWRTRETWRSFRNASPTTSSDKFTSSRPPSTRFEATSREKLYFPFLRFEIPSLNSIYLGKIDQWRSQKKYSIVENVWLVWYLRYTIVGILGTV